ncbi:DgaE family pyridoxal phosphate-dependent ammonia lyase [Bacillus sp. Marseille-P3800]|uniref:DgaE family pyridoxal phosphate-dependent ammonia lyase n=1 Tax=Bacillus sp. Marseille-P3800 TaxID=2014782 RepID=UPI000C0837F9|nr:DgaE family pyridoxal phosphate-dependent ammonia lyase [Bacillus sp. Marseille-P3800]
MNFKQKLHKAINASGRMTILGVSTLSDRVTDEMRYGGKHYFEMADLYEQSGKALAAHLNTEDAMITNSASASITLAIAGLITKDDPYAVEHLHKVAPNVPHEILLMKGHNVNYGAPIETMVSLAGAKVKEVGYANGCDIPQIEQAITEKTVALLFVQSHHCVQKNMPSLQEVRELCLQCDLPLLVDAAAEDGIDQFGTRCDLVAFSGSKAIEGPSSGILAGAEPFISYAKMHRSFIGRAMKVGKETVFGLLAAIEDYGKNTVTLKEQEDELRVFQSLSALPGVETAITEDPAGRPIKRCRIFIDPVKAKLNARQLVQALKLGDTPIYTRDYHANEGHIDLDPRPLLPGDASIIVDRLNELLGDSVHV